MSRPTNNLVAGTKLVEVSGRRGSAKAGFPGDFRDYTAGAGRRSVAATSITKWAGFTVNDAWRIRPNLDLESRVWRYEYYGRFKHNKSPELDSELLLRSGSSMQTLQETHSQRQVCRSPRDKPGVGGACGSKIGINSPHASVFAGTISR